MRMKIKIGKRIKRKRRSKGKRQIPGTLPGETKVHVPAIS
jgi:hypothetical protein